MDSKAGSALMFVLVTMVVLGTAVAVVLSTTVVQARVSREKDQFVKSFHNASAALEYLKYYIKASNYATNGRNEWLANHSSDAGTILTSTEIPEFASIGATVTITRNGSSPWYHIESRVTVPVADPDVTIERVVEVWVREREPFSEYMFFVGSGITFGETTVAGRVHANGSLTFNRKCRNPGTNEPAKFWGDTTSTSGYSFSGSASELKELFTVYNADGTVKYVSDYDFGVDVRPMPEANDITALWTVGNAEGYNANSTIEFVTVQDSFTGEYETKVYLDDPSPHTGLPRDLPAGGVISCDTREVVITGTTTNATGTTYDVAGINGRVTIVNKSTSGSGQISISSPIIYIDKYGEPAYYHGAPDSTKHYDYRDTDWFDDSRKDNWANRSFEKNTNYVGSSAVGIVSAKDIRYGVDLPASTSLEIDAAILANGSFGYWHDNKVKRNLRILGSLTFNGSYGRYSGSPVTGKGYSYSGIYQYDQRLRGNAPPHFLGTARPEFFAWRVVR
jgi:hypothetical protein